MEAVTLYEFQATAEDELSFRKSQIIKIVQKHVDGQWHKAELDGREGFVPSNYVTMKEHDWYVGKVSREETKTKLMSDKIQPDGAFIVRDSESSPGDFTLAVKFQGAVQHFKVLRDGGKYFIWAVKFNSLNELIDYHRTSSVSRSETIYLRDYVKKKTLYATALYDFKPKEADDLGFTKGQKILVLDHEQETWWRGELNNKRGMFPATYVSLQDS